MDQDQGVAVTALVEQRKVELQRRAPIALGDELSTALAPVLRPGARVIAESDRRAPLKLDLQLLDERRYGDTLILIYGP